VRPRAVLEEVVKRTFKESISKFVGERGTFRLRKFHRNVKQQSNMM